MTRTDPVRERLLTSARDLFTRKGYEATSVREITADARANLGAITYHFGSKEALYHAVLESVAAPLVQAIATASERPGTAIDRLDAIVRALLDHIATHPGTPAVLLRELASDRPLPPPMARAMRGNLGAIVGTITAGQREGTIRTDDSILLALSVVAQPFFFTVAGRLIREASGVDRDDPSVRQRVVDHIATSIRRFVARPQEAEP